MWKNWKKNYIKIMLKPYAYLQTMIKIPVKFQKDPYKTVGGVALTRSPLQTRNHAKMSKLKCEKSEKN